MCKGNKQVSGVEHVFLTSGLSQARPPFFLPIYYAAPPAGREMTVSYDFRKASCHLLPCFFFCLHGYTLIYNICPLFWTHSTLDVNVMKVNQKD